MDDPEFDRPRGGALARHTRDLTRDARAGRLEPVRCRDEEVARVIDILLRHGKNNPVLVGPAGVGKTAIAEGLAQRLVGGDVPLVLRRTRLLALDHVSLLAGTSYRGQYEERIRSLVEETSADPDVVLFVDELHNLIGQGTAIGVAMDAANMLKPALVRGDFRVIGATTDEEYDRWVRGDPALERRFQRVLVRELTSEETLDVLRSRLDRLERHHNVAIAEDALHAAIALTDRHMLDRRRPDRAIDVLDEACAHTQAVSRYSARAEAMILRRRALMRSLAAQATSGRDDAGAPRANGDGGGDSLGSGDEFESLARDGLSALQRFGAELEAIFTASAPRDDQRERRESTEGRDGAGELGERGERGERGGGVESPAEPKPAMAAAAAAGPDGEGIRHPADAEPVLPPVTPTRSLTVLDVELRSLLIEEGIVVRGLDVARVVAVATGQTVRWSE